jgi:CheY-like chemotaxis protein
MVASRASRTVIPPMDVWMNARRAVLSGSRRRVGAPVRALRLRTRPARAPARFCSRPTHTARVRLGRPRTRAGPRRDVVDPNTATTILVVEDDQRIAALLCKGLRAHGYHAESVGTGRAALSRLSRAGIALVILDLGLPDLDGVEVLQRVRDTGSDVPVIVVTAHVRGERDIRVLGLTVHGFVTKPFVFEHLAECVRGGLANGRAR